MLSLTEIEKQYPANLRPFKNFLLREYLQYKILQIIFSSEFANKLCFLGGTCLRIVHNNSRFSEDLDFDNSGLTENQFKKIAEIIKVNLEAEGYAIEMKNVMKGAYHCYIRFPGLLFKEGLSGYRNEKILIQLDTEPKHFKFTPDMVIINKFDVFTEIAVTPIQLLLSQKLYAILNRTRAKGRDFFDTMFLLSKSKPDYRYLKQKLKISTPDQLREAILKKCSTINMNVMVKDVQEFLFNPNDKNKIRLFVKYFEKVEL
ncbi:MAG: nucleotidyl transferase AbiEii/AbiGii toxin family protein [Bacteroidia bacterium]